MKKSVMGMKCLLMAGILNEQLFSPHLFRLWHTGADELAFKPAEDEDFDVSYSTLYMYFNVAAIYIF